MRRYNPGFLTDDQLMQQFCVRQAEFESVVEFLRDCTGPSNPPQLVIGPRGSGKTTLLLRVVAEVRNDPDLSSFLFPVVFGEESYEVTSAGEFWLECLSQLAHQVPRPGGDPELHQYSRRIESGPGRPGTCGAMPQCRTRLCETVRQAG